MGEGIGRVKNGRSGKNVAGKGEGKEKQNVILRRSG